MENKCPYNLECYETEKECPDYDESNFLDCPHWKQADMWDIIYPDNENNDNSKTKTC